jgi:hypothetical protein
VTRTPSQISPPTRCNGGARGAPYLTSAVWPVASRSKQYAGNRVVKVGGIALNIDADRVASAVARK